MLLLGSIHGFRRREGKVSFLGEREERTYFMFLWSLIEEAAASKCNNARNERCPGGNWGNRRKGGEAEVIEKKKNKNGP